MCSEQQGFLQPRYHQRFHRLSHGPLRGQVLGGSGGGFWGHLAQLTCSRSATRRWGLPSPSVCSEPPLEASSSHTGTFHAGLCPQMGVRLTQPWKAPWAETSPTPPCPISPACGWRAGQTLVEVTPGVTPKCDRRLQGGVTRSSVLGGFFVALLTKLILCTRIRLCDGRLAAPPDPACPWLELPPRTVCPFQPFPPGVPGLVSW